MLTRTGEAKAGHVLAGQTHSYCGGNATLLDELNVQLALNDVHLSFYQVGQNLATTCPKLQRMSGPWAIKS